MDNPKPRQLYLMKIESRGQALTKNYQVGDGLCECCKLGIDFADGGKTVYMVDREVDANKIRNHVLRKSTDGGASFGAPIEISNDGWQVPSCPHSGPSIGRDSRGQLHVSWFTQGRSEQEAGIYYSVSKDGGKRFAPRTMIHANTAPETLYNNLDRRRRRSGLSSPGAISTPTIERKSTCVFSPPMAEPGVRFSSSAMPKATPAGPCWRCGKIQFKSPGLKPTTRTRVWCSEMRRCGNDYAHAKKYLKEPAVTVAGAAFCQLRNRHGFDGQSYLGATCAPGTAKHGARHRRQCHSFRLEILGRQICRTRDISRQAAVS